MTGVVYVNGAFVDEVDAHVRFDDRGFLFADGIYEVIRCYGGTPFRLEAHIERLRTGAEQIKLNLPNEVDDAHQLIAELADRNGVAGGEFKIYVQVTRGTGTRAHVFARDAKPTIVGWIFPVTPDSPEVAVQRAITVSDRRWEMCNIKSTGLLLNVLAKHTAAEANADEAIFVRDGVVTEGASTNFFGALGSTVYTHPRGVHILSGITRTVVLELLEKEGVTVVEQPIPAERLPLLDEAFVTATGCEVAPIVAIDGRAVGDGGGGPMTRKLIDDFRKFTRDVSMDDTHAGAKVL
jgi:D-alanine transaminase